MTRSPHTDPAAALMQAGNALLLGGPDNEFADRIVCGAAKNVAIRSPRRRATGRIRGFSAQAPLLSSG